MDMTDTPLLSMLRQKMAWLGQRQNLLSQNVANADTPGYSPSDLKPIDFARTLRATVAGPARLDITDPRHLSGARPVDPYKNFQTRDRLADASGNTVSLEQEMIKVAETQAQFQAATNLYAKALGMMRTAIGK